MEYSIKFVYKDDKDISIKISDDTLDSFFETLNQGKIFWTNEDQEQGFWLDLKEIRYVELFGKKEVSNGKAQDRNSSREVYDDNERCGLREEENTEDGA
jgi:hypothetical protein